MLVRKHTRSKFTQLSMEQLRLQIVRCCKLFKDAAFVVVIVGKVTKLCLFIISLCETFFIFFIFLQGPLRIFVCSPIYLFIGAFSVDGGVPWELSWRGTKNFPAYICFFTILCSSSHAFLTCSLLQARASTYHH